MKRLITAMAVITLLVTGCGDDEDDGGGAATTTTEAPATTQGTGEATALAVESPATNEKSFTAPDEIRGGVVNITYKNNGKLKHEAFLLGIGDKSEDEAIKAFTPVVKTQEGVPIPEFLKPGGGVPEVGPGQTLSSHVTVPAGRYLILCNLSDADSQEEQEGPPPDLPVHFEQGMRKLLTVTGGTADPSALPKGDGTITAREYSFDVPAITSGHRKLVFENAGPKEIHVAFFGEWPAGVDEAAATKAFQDFAQAMAEGKPPPPGPEFEDLVSSSILDPGRGATFEADFKSGRTYSVLCFISDRAGGPPHAAKGMVKNFTVR